MKPLSPFHASLGIGQARGFLLVAVLGLLALGGQSLRAADQLLSTTGYSSVGSSQSYTVPTGTDFVVVKAWGAGGGNGLGAGGGGGGLVTAKFNVSPSQTITVTVGGGGRGYGDWPGPGGGGYNGGGNSIEASGAGGGYTSVVGPSSAWAVYAGAGGGAGWGAAGGPGGGHASSTESNGSDSATAVAGAGAYADAWGGGGGAGFEDFGENGGGGSQFQGGQGGADGGPDAWYVDLAATGGAGGGGYYGGGGGGTGDRNNGGGAGGGGGSSYISGSPVTSTFTLGSGSTPGGVSDANYPGGGVAYGGTSAWQSGGGGYVVILAYRILHPPVINSSTSTQSRAQNQAANYTITATNTPTSYGASNLVPGFSVNSSTGAITGLPTLTGSWSTTISATNADGTGSATVLWNISAASGGPNTPTRLQIVSISPGVVVLKWVASTGTAPAGYNVYRNGVKINTSLITGTTFTDSGLTAGTSYSYVVRAEDSSSYLSNPTGSVTGTPPTASSSGSFEIFSPLP